VNRATTLGELRIPPNNRLEQLVGDRAGQHSIRINDQFRVCFRFDQGSAFDVEIRLSLNERDAMARQVAYPHPGEILSEEFMLPMGITAYRLAKDIGVDQTRISEIVAGRRAITVDTNLRLSRYFGTNDEFWTGP
jgi:addiction module HigA family antidote